jgi:hypothetical protein
LKLLDGSQREWNSETREREREKRKPMFGSLVFTINAPKPETRNEKNTGRVYPI